MNAKEQIKALISEARYATTIERCEELRNQARALADEAQDREVSLLSADVECALQKMYDKKLYGRR